MKLTEIIFHNFGKFTEKDIVLSEGVNLIYGENEAGKSTLHAFLKGMLFGMERGRGRAAANDNFSRYEPWNNPNYYAGVLRFECGRRSFCLERHFDKYARGAKLLCEDDGEELSLEHGDLEMLLCGMQESDYENTIAVGQLKTATNQSLAVELKNYAANYYATGNSDLNLEAALLELKDRKKEIDKEIKEAERQKQEKRDKIEAEVSYVWRDIHLLEKDIIELEQEIEVYEEKKKEQEAKILRKRAQEEQAGRFDNWRIHPIEVISMILGVVLSMVLFHKPWNYLVTIVVALAEGLYAWNCLKDGKKTEEQQEPEEIVAGYAEYERLVWKKEKLQEDYREKQTQYGNLQEQLEELDEVSEEFKEQTKHCKALDQAGDILLQLSKKMRDRLTEELDERISRIMCEITDGKYEKVWVDDKLHLALWSEGRKIQMEQVSQGTVEQLYFALRMSAAELLYEESFPMILDDTFAYYDDKRLQKTLFWLSKNKEQVILLTCQGREEKAMQEAGIPYKKIVL